MFSFWEGPTPRHRKARSTSSGSHLENWCLCWRLQRWLSPGMEIGCGSAGHIQRPRNGDIYIYLYVGKPCTGHESSQGMPGIFVDIPYMIHIIHYYSMLLGYLIMLKHRAFDARGSNLWRVHLVDVCLWMLCCKKSLMGRGFTIKDGVLTCFIQQHVQQHMWKSASKLWGKPTGGWGVELHATAHSYFYPGSFEHKGQWQHIITQNAHMEVS